MFHKTESLLKKTISAFESMRDSREFSDESNCFLLSARKLLLGLVNADQEDYKNILIGTILLVMATETFKYANGRFKDAPSLRELFNKINHTGYPSLLDETVTKDEFGWMEENFDSYKYNNSQIESTILELGKKIRLDSTPLNIHLASFPKLAAILPQDFFESHVIKPRLA